MRLLSQGSPSRRRRCSPIHGTRLPRRHCRTSSCSCARNLKDGYELQQELIGQVRETEEARKAFSKAVKRMEDGKPPQLDAPEPQSGRDPSLLETWQFGRGVCERVARQLRCVGNALAWQVFRFERRNIIALCQNAPPGVWAGKAGTPAELDAVRVGDYRQMASSPFCTT